MQLRQGLLASLTALMLLAPAAAMAGHRNHHGHHGGGPRVGVTLNFGSPYRHYGHGGYYNPHWNRGYWHHGWHGGRHGRWWVVGPSYYFYNEIPVYTHYETTRIIEPAAPVVAGPPPAQNWYLCEDSGYYYPHVTECASDWVVVPATPPR